MNSNIPAITLEQLDSSTDTFNTNELQQQALQWINYINSILEQLSMQITVADDSVFGLVSQDEKFQIAAKENEKPDFETLPAVLSVLANCLLSLIANLKFDGNRQMAEAVTTVAIPVFRVSEIDKLLNFITNPYSSI